MADVPLAVMVQAAKVAQLTHATLFPAGQLTVPQLLAPNCVEE
jgi:hypothetical protein